MPEFEAQEADLLEQRQSAADAQGALDTPDEVDLEAPEADTVEQRRGLRDDAPAGPPTERPVEADDADAADQAREVGGDDDEYR